MAEIPTNLYNTQAREPKESVMTKVRDKICSLLWEMKWKIQKQPKKEAVPPEPVDGDDGYDEDNLPDYIRAIDRGEDPK